MKNNHMDINFSSQMMTKLFSSADLFSLFQSVVLVFSLLKEEKLLTTKEQNIYSGVGGDQNRAKRRVGLTFNR